MTDIIKFELPYLTSSRKCTFQPTKASDVGSSVSTVVEQPWYPVYRYFSETDTLSIYLVKATRGLIDSSDEVTAGLLVDYTSSEEIVALDIALASKKILAHFWDDAGIYDEKPPPQLHASFDAVQQIFTISFGDSCAKVKTRATDDKRITVYEDENGHWASIVIFAAGKANADLTASK